MEEPIELHKWSAYQFGKFEHRISGYTNDGTWLMTEPLMTISSATGLVETTAGTIYKPLNPVEATEIMNTMYNVGRWVDLNIKPQPRDCTRQIFEQVTGISETTND